MFMPNSVDHLLDHLLPLKSLIKGARQYVHIMCADFFMGGLVMLNGKEPWRLALINPHKSVTSSKGRTGSNEPDRNVHNGLGR